MMDIFHVQIIFLVISFAVTALSALSPVLFVWWKSKNNNEDQVIFLFLLAKALCEVIIGAEPDLNIHLFFVFSLIVPLVTQPALRRS